MNFYSLFGAAIAEERKRLALSQAKAATACGVSREMWGKYERDQAVMGTEVLARFAATGADVLYILTGQRAGAAVAEQLPPDEQLLLDAYRGMKAPDRKALLAEMLTGKKAKPAKEAGQNVKGKGNRVAGRDYNEAK